MTKIKNKTSFIKTPLLKQVNKLMKAEYPTVTYVYGDGSKKHQPINETFFRDGKKVKTEEQISEDLKAISNDMGAKYFII